MLSLPATLTQDHARQCLEKLTEGVQAEAAQVVVDAAELRQFDSSALAVLLALRRECARAGKRFAVQGLPQRLRDLATLYGIEGLLPTA
jgi:phospholipid transport system transporter-binding protein